MSQSHKKEHQDDAGGGDKIVERKDKSRQEGAFIATWAGKLMNPDRARGGLWETHRGRRNIDRKRAASSHDHNNVHASKERSKGADVRQAKPGSSLMKEARSKDDTRFKRTGKKGGRPTGTGEII